MPEPTTKTEPKAYLGMLNFYVKFLKNVATIAEPLYRLLRKEEKWPWTKEHSDAFAATKRLLTSSLVLAFYDVGNPIALLCDPLAYGLGTVIFHETMEDERLIEFSS